MTTKGHLQGCTNPTCRQAWSGEMFKCAVTVGSEHHETQRVLTKQA